MEAAKSGDQNALLAIFGVESKDIIFSGDPVQDNLRIRGRGKDRSLAFQFPSFLSREGQVAVMANGDLPVLAGDEKWLRLAN